MVKSGNVAQRLPADLRCSTAVRQVTVKKNKLTKLFGTEVGWETALPADRTVNSRGRTGQEA